MSSSDGFYVSVVLPAGGNGERLGASKPKQFIEVLGKPILCYTIEAFIHIPWIDRIIIPIPDKWKTFAEKLKEEHKFFKVDFVSGLNTRHRSIFEGLKALSSIESSKIVVIHDAVRPFITDDFLMKVCQAARNHMASGAVRSLVSTVVKSSEDGLMLHSLDRRYYKESHTPQAFHYGTILEAYKQCTDDDFIHGTECLNLVQKYCNVTPKLVDGPEYLWKVTHKKDLILMENYIKERDEM